jgi:hypothetical protein
MYSDYMRYKHDENLAFKIADMVEDLQPPPSQGKRLPVALIGKHSPDIGKNYLRGEVIGYSFFDFSGNGRALTFMKTLGINFSAPNGQQMQLASVAARSMPIYPSSGCVEMFENVIVVKLSE